MKTSSVEDVAVRGGVDQTRLRILTATRRLYAERGSKGTTTREVADSAGVNEATLFRHFGTKQLLIDAMLDFYSKHAMEVVSDILVGIRDLGTIEEQLNELGVAAITSIRSKQDLIKISMAEEASNPDGMSCAWRAPTEARARLVTFFEEKVRAGELRGDPALLTRTFMSLFFAYVMARKIWSDCESPQDEAVAMLVDIFLNGARA